MGALALLPLIVLVVVFVSVWNVAANWGFKFLENKFLDFLINCFIVSAGLCFVGWILEKPMFRGIFDSLFATLPIISWFHKFIPSSDQLEKFKSGSYSEARVEIYPGIFVRGILIREWPEGEVWWCRVLVPTTPVPMTGNLIEVEKSKVVITGRTAEDLFRTYLSLGMK
jgi:uncharacterized membrane protein